MEFAQGRDDIIANAARIGDRTVLADPDAFVDAAAEVFGEVAEQVRMHFTDGAIDIDLDARSGRLRE